MPPSPTAAATRFTDPERTSPMAKIPGALVSRANGSRSAFHCPAFIASAPVKTKPFSSRAISGGEPVGRRVGADEDEKRRGIPPRCRAGPPVDDLDRLELFASVHGDDLGSRFHP